MINKKATHFEMNGLNFLSFYVYETALSFVIPDLSSLS